MNWSPIEIELMIHYYAHCFIKENNDAPTVISATDKLSKLGLIEKDDPNEKHTAGFMATEKGKAFIEKICATELPRQVWV